MSLPLIAQPTAPPRSSRRWLALAVLALAQFLVVLDASIVNIALPSIGEQLALDTAGIGWIITAYVLPFGGLLLLGGRLADRYGHRRLFLIGSAGFVVASALAGLAGSGEVLLIARALQGISAALLAPASLALVTQLFTTTADRAKALGIWGAVAGIGSAAGVLLGGVLTGAFGWQAVFFVNLPIGVVVLAAIPFLITRDVAKERTRLDLPGAAAISFGLAALVAAFASAGQSGFVHPVTLGLAAGAIALLAAFVVIEKRTALPLVSFGIFRNRAVTAGNLAILLAGSGMVGLFFALSVYMQAVLGYDALTAGLSQLPLAGTLVVVAGVIAPLVTRFGPRAVLVAALLVFAAGLVWLAGAPSDAAFVAHLLGPTLVIGAGIGGVFIAGTQLAVEGVREADSGLAGGLVNTSQQVGGALGLAILTTIAAVRTSALETAGISSAEAMTGGLSWIFLGSAIAAIFAAVVVVLVRERGLRSL